MRIIAVITDLLAAPMARAMIRPQAR